MKKEINVPLNRAEGDLEIRVELEDGIVTDARSSGVMFRGIENMLKGRGMLDGLVITPRVCGICGTAHLTAASRALDDIFKADVPKNAVLIRNIALMTEHIQSDMRHAFLMYMVDFVNPLYCKIPLFEEAQARYAPFSGSAVIETIKSTKTVLELVAIIGGQWPHSSYMVPGGIVSSPKLIDIMQCRYLLDKYIGWYEEKIIGCSLERWFDVKSCKDLDEWIEENPAHYNSELGFFIRYARAINLDKIGQGCGNFICFGQLDIPKGSKVQSLNGSSSTLIPSGVSKMTKVEPFFQENIEEHVKYSWYEDYDGGKHPFEGLTKPYATGNEGIKYSWLKAPRYKDMPAETGPLAEMIVSQNPLFVDIINTHGPSAFTRELARLVRPPQLMPAMQKWIREIDFSENYYTRPENITDGKGIGLTHASRGALAHFVSIKDSKIERYQIISPTSWNGSPRDYNNIRGPWEEALMGTQVRDPDNPVELGHVIRSFDPCLVCAVHMVKVK